MNNNPENIVMLSPIDRMIEDALKKCKTRSHLAKAAAKDLEENGFHGELVADLIMHCEQALKYAHAYQSYINAANTAD